MAKGAARESSYRRDGYNPPVLLFRGLCQRFARLLAASLMVASCGSGTSVAPGVGASSNPAGSRPGALTVAVQSNVTRQDYAGSAACASCHPDQTAAWRRSPMHGMTRDARDAEVRAPFDGTRWPFKSDAVVLDRRGADRFVRIESAGAVVATYRVTRVIGGRTREDFAGVDVAGGSEEVVLPFSFVYGTGAAGTAGSFRYKGYSVMVRERASLRAGPVWSRTCIFCHNTVPEFDRLVGALAGPRSPAYQGEQVDPWLAPERRSRARVADVSAFADVAREEVARLGGTKPRDDDAVGVARRTIDVVRSGFDGEALVEEGIGCEACHGGGREHAADPRVHPSFVPTAPWLEVSPRPSTPQAINHACARCHPSAGHDRAFGGAD